MSEQLHEPGHDMMAEIERLQKRVAELEAREGELVRAAFREGYTRATWDGGVLSMPDLTVLADQFIAKIDKEKP